MVSVGIENLNYHFKFELVLDVFLTEYLTIARLLFPSSTIGE
jgi:hypothetical protein